jgi:hypothetical protein
VILIVAGWWRGACCSGCRKARCTRCPAEVAVHAADVAVAPQSEIVCAACFLAAPEASRFPESFLGIVRAAVERRRREIAIAGN